jgi:hypothetical protein
MPPKAAAKAKEVHLSTVKFSTLAVFKDFNRLTMGLALQKTWSILNLLQRSLTRKSLISILFLNGFHPGAKNSST